MNKFIKIASTFILSTFFLEGTFADEVNIYTSRHYDSDDALYAEFTRVTVEMP